MKFVLSYSCGKDSTLALHKMLEQGHEPVGLLVMVADFLGIGKSGVAQVEIEQGASSAAIARQLDEAGVIRYSTLFRLYTKLMGFDGKSLVNPRQIRVVHEVFTPTEKDIIFAEKVVREIDDKKAKGIGVFTVDGKMIDIAFYDGAKRTIELAKASGVYEGDL